MTALPDLDLAGNLYAQLAGRTPRATHATTGSNGPGSRPPIDVAVVGHMQTIELFLDTWIGHARWLLDPQPRIPLPVACPDPACGQPTLVAYPRRGLIICRSGLRHDGPTRWPEQLWPRLGVLTGARTDHRTGARPRWQDLAHAVGT